MADMSSLETVRQRTQVLVDQVNAALLNSRPESGTQTIISDPDKPEQIASVLKQVEGRLGALPPRHRHDVETEVHGIRQALDEARDAA